MSNKSVFIFTDEEKDILEKINDNIEDVKGDVSQVDNKLNSIYSNNMLTVGTVVANGSLRGNLIIGDEKLVANKALFGNNTFGFTNTLIYPLRVDGTSVLNGDVYVNDKLRFIVPTDINDETFIRSNAYSGAKTEMLLYKGNNTASDTAGPDRIRMKSGQLILETYGGGSVNNDTDITTNPNILINHTSINLNRDVVVSEKLTVSGKSTLGELECSNLTLTNDLTVNKTLIVSDPNTGRGNIQLGTGTLGDANDVASISTNQYSTDDAATELVIYKGNNTQTHGPDRIRLKAANIVFETYETFSPDNSTTSERSNMIIDRFGKVTINGNLSINGDLTVNGNIQAYQVQAGRLKTQSLNVNGLPTSPLFLQAGDVWLNTDTNNLTVQRTTWTGV